MLLLRSLFYHSRQRRGVRGTPREEGIRARAHAQKDDSGSSSE